MQRCWMCSYMPSLSPQALKQTLVVQTHIVDHNLTMWERPTTPFHRTNWVCGPTPDKEHSAGSGSADSAPAGTREGWGGAGPGAQRPAPSLSSPPRALLGCL